MLSAIGLQSDRGGGAHDGEGVEEGQVVGGGDGDFFDAGLLAGRDEGGEVGEEGVEEFKLQG